MIKQHHAEDKVSCPRGHDQAHNTLSEVRTSDVLTSNRALECPSFHTDHESLRIDKC